MDNFVPLRIQRPGANSGDFLRFADNIKNLYDKSEGGFVETIIKNGMYDDSETLLSYVREDSEMYEKLMALFKIDLEAAENKGKAEGRAEGKIERRRLADEIGMLREKLSKYEATMA